MIGKVKPLWYDGPMLFNLPDWFIFFFAGLFGACMGSFANVCILRLPSGESIVHPASRCPACENKLSWWENIPVISYIFLGGKCRNCSAKISMMYPLVELFCAALSILTIWYFKDFQLYFIYFLLFLLPLTIVSVIDIREMIIPDVISIPGIAVGFAAHIFWISSKAPLYAALESVLGILIGGGILFIVAYVYEKIKKQEGLGGGDVKLIAMIGAFLGWKASLSILLMSSMLGSIVGIIIIIVLRKDMKFAIPYGPFIAASGMIYLFLGKLLLNWYFGLFR